MASKRDFGLWREDADHKLATLVAALHKRCLAEIELASHLLQRCCRQRIGTVAVEQNDRQLVPAKALLRKNINNMKWQLHRFFV